ncbi:hypothetical protein [Streptosporangium amethystogenes]|uniref:hypothetical protein n=1 Tax=Streptosporangium amethystogenes TaxID=2002 RepID=UPI0004C87F39|nr:hypothetical protein [Streptosporangium amethystogenes]
MTWLRQVLDDIAEDSPRVDLAERTIRIHERRRRTVTALVAAVTVTVIVLGATAGARLLPTERQDSSGTGGVADLPDRGVGPLSHAYKTFCNPSEGTAPPDCRDGAWRVVTRAGRTYHVPDALTGFSSPLAISQDGRRIAYYAVKEGTFKVRELDSGGESAAPVKIPTAWLGSVSHLLMSDDGRFLAFTKRPPLKDPAMLIDMRERMTRPLPNGGNPIGISKDGDTVMLAEYSPKSRLQMMSHLWTTSTAGNQVAVTLPRAYKFGALAPDGETVVGLENRMTVNSKPCLTGALAHLDARTGKVRRKVTVSGLPTKTHNVSLRAWLNPREITVIAIPNPVCTGKRLPDADDAPATTTDPPYVTVTAYALNVGTGKARRIGGYTAQDFFGLVLPGHEGTL